MAAANSREQAKQYLSSHKIPQMFESLLSCLMLERPEDPIAFIEKKMNQIRDVGLANVNWEYFIFHMHPYRDSLRRHLIKDGSKFDKEREAEDAGSSKFDLDRERTSDSYKPDVFKLTESQQLES